MRQYSRHKILINHYQLNQTGAASSFKRDTSRDRTDNDVLRDNHRFLWSSDEDDDTADEKKTTVDKNKEWEQRLAKKYYDQLFKEYAICDLSKFKDNKLAMRWRIEEEVIRGKGHFICGEKSCTQDEGLRSWEVNFKYEEQGDVKNALVKLRLCPSCSDKMNYHHKKKEVKVKQEPETTSHPKKHKKHKKRKHRESSSEDEEITKKKKPSTAEDIEIRTKRILDSILF